MCTTSFHPPLEKYYFASVLELAKSLPTVCSERMCLHARAFLVALEKRLGWQGETPWLAGRIALVGHEN